MKKQGQETPPTDALSMNVVITSMPAIKDKPLFRDTSRMLSISAFIFSVATGVYAIYQGWDAKQETTIEAASKLVDQYYFNLDKITKFNPLTELPQINLLRSQGRSAALRAFNNAKSVKHRVDDGTWQALAQINANERNLLAAEEAWLASLEVTGDPDVFFFGLRGLDVAYYLMGRFHQAKALNDIILKLPELEIISDFSFLQQIAGPASAGQISKRSALFYNAPQEQRLIEKFNVNMVRLANDPTLTCPEFATIFDAATNLLSEAKRVTGDNNPWMQSFVATQSQSLQVFAQRRTGCIAMTATSRFDAACQSVSVTLDASDLNFYPFKGAPLDPSDMANTAYKSPMVLPEASQCVIDATSSLSCDWPERDDIGTKARRDQFIDLLRQCPKLGTLASTTTMRSSDRRDVESTTVNFAVKTKRLLIERTYLKATPNRPQGYWQISARVNGS